MFFKAIVGRFLTILVLGTSVIAGAQRQPSERASLPQRGTEQYWIAIDELSDRAVHFAYAKRFVQLREASLTDRQCQQYSRAAVDYADQLAAAKQTGVSAQSEFWNDVRAYAISMIGAPGVPTPIDRTSKYWVTTGSEAEDRELRRLVSLEIDNASSRLIPEEYSSSALKPDCCNAGQGPTSNVQP